MDKGSENDNSSRAYPENIDIKALQTKLFDGSSGNSVTRPRPAKHKGPPQVQHLLQPPQHPVTTLHAPQPHPLQHASAVNKGDNYLLTSLCKRRPKKTSGTRPPSRAFVRRLGSSSSDDNVTSDIGVYGVRRDGKNRQSDNNESDLHIRQQFQSCPNAKDGHEESHPTLRSRPMDNTIKECRRNCGKQRPRSLIHRLESYERKDAGIYRLSRNNIDEEQRIVQRSLAETSTTNIPKKVTEDKHITWTQQQQQLPTEVNEDLRNEHGELQGKLQCTNANQRRIDLFKAKQCNGAISNSSITSTKEHINTNESPMNRVYRSYLTNQNEPSSRESRTEKNQNESDICASANRTSHQKGSSVSRMVQRINHLAGRTRYKQLQE